MWSVNLIVFYIIYYMNCFLCFIFDLILSSINHFENDNNLTSNNFKKN